MAVTEDTVKAVEALKVTVGGDVDAVDRRLAGLWVRAWDEIRGAWVEAATDLIAASDGDVWPGAGVVTRSERAQVALSAASTRLTELGVTSSTVIADAAGSVVDATGEAAPGLATTQLPPGHDFTLSRLDTTALEGIVTRCGEQVTVRLWPLSMDATEAMRRALIRGVALGQNPRVAARRMVKTAEGHFNGGLSRAMTIARTEILDAHRQANQETWSKNPELVNGWTWVSALDDRSCPSCWGMHGTVHDLTESGPNDHQQGRCTSIPTVKPWKDLGYNILEPPSLLKSADAEFAKLTKDEQLAIMGPARLQALNTGAVDLRGLSTERVNPGWRNSYVPVSVRDLPGVA